MYIHTQTYEENKIAAPLSCPFLAQGPGDEVLPTTGWRGFIFPLPPTPDATPPPHQLPYHVTLTPTEEAASFSLLFWDPFVKMPLLLGWSLVL